MMRNNSIIRTDVERICNAVDLRSLSKKTILVSGASGLIGTYVLACLDWLQECGLDIQVYGLVFSKTPLYLREMEQHGRCVVLKVDLADSSQYSRLPEADVMIHAAGYAQPIRFMSNPISTLKLNTVGTAALLERLNEEGRFLFISSSEVYSGLGKAPFSEEDIGTTTPLHPRSSYIEGKRGGEAMCVAYGTEGVNATSIRLGDTYGPGTRKYDKRAINSFIERGLESGKIELMDPGSSVRTFCYISDAIELMWKILLQGENLLYNLGGYSTVTIAEMAEMIAGIIGVPLVIPHDQGGVSGAPRDLRLDLSRVEKEFGKMEYITLEKGLRKTIEWQGHMYGQD